jgi:hypothetical protein
MTGLFDGLIAASPKMSVMLSQEVTASDSAATSASFARRIPTSRRLAAVAKVIILPIIGLSLSVARIDTGAPVLATGLQATPCQPQVHCRSTAPERAVP